MFGLFKNSSPKWCCPGFGDTYGNAGHRGFSILIKKDDLGARFLIQSRAVEQTDQEQFHALLRTEFPVSSVTETGMRFCPWCGVNLKRFYGRRAADLNRPGFSIS